MLQTVQHGFPNKPTCLAWDPVLRLMAIGTASGNIKVYPLYTNGGITNEIVICDCI